MDTVAIETCTVERNRDNTEHTVLNSHGQVIGHVVWMADGWHACPLGQPMGGHVMSAAEGAVQQVIKMARQFKALEARDMADLAAARASFRSMYAEALTAVGTAVRGSSQHNRADAKYLCQFFGMPVPGARVSHDTVAGRVS